MCVCVCVCGSRLEVLERELRTGFAEARSERDGLVRQLQCLSSALAESRSDLSQKLLVGFDSIHRHLEDESGESLEEEAHGAPSSSNACFASIAGGPSASSGDSGMSLPAGEATETESLSDGTRELLDQNYVPRSESSARNRGHGDLHPHQRRQ